MIPALAVLPLQDAGTRPAHTTGLELHAGFSPISLDLPPLPVFPALTLGVALERGITDRLDVGLRYTTWLGFDHRLGPEVQLGLLSMGDWDFGLRSHPWVRLAGAAGSGLSYGGDLSTATAAVCTVRTRPFAISAETGATAQWVLFERIGGESYADTRPWLATVDVVAEVAWADRYARALALRLELGIPQTHPDPISILGVRPRIVMAGHFGGP